MRRTILFALPLLAGCLVTGAADYATHPHPAGTMLSDGTIAPCHGIDIEDRNACGQARFNAPLVPKIENGMTKEQVRNLMRHDPERREMNGDTDVWMYMTDYNARKMTAIVFSNGRVSALRQAPWKD